MTSAFAIELRIVSWWWELFACNHVNRISVNILNFPLQLVFNFNYLHWLCCCYSDAVIALPLCISLYWILFLSGTPLKPQEDAVLVTSDTFPPPPGFAVDSPFEKPQTADNFRNKSLLTGTCQSATSAISATLMSNVSFRSSHTDDSEDDGRRKVRIDRIFNLSWPRMEFINCLEGVCDFHCLNVFWSCFE